jgi:hypothetical protein
VAGCVAGAEARRRRVGTSFARRKARTAREDRDCGRESAFEEGRWSREVEEGAGEAGRAWSPAVTLHFKPVHDLISLAYTFVQLLAGQHMTCPWAVKPGIDNPNPQAPSDVVAERNRFVQDVCQDPVRGESVLSTRMCPLLGSRLGAYIHELNRIDAANEGLSEAMYTVPDIPAFPGLDDDVYLAGPKTAPPADAKEEDESWESKGDEDGDGRGAARGGGSGGGDDE